MTSDMNERPEGVREKECPIDGGPCEGQGTDAQCRACVRIGALEDIATIAREIVSWDWTHLLVYHPDSEELIRDGKRLEAALQQLDATKKGGNHGPDRV